jgi:hypothetical protein
MTETTSSATRCRFVDRFVRLKCAATSKGDLWRILFWGNVPSNQATDCDLA